MPYVIAEPCIEVKNGACVEVCPVDCIHTTPGEAQHYIDPDICIECEQCAFVCPVEAIFLDKELPEQWLGYVDKNAKFFRHNKEALMPVPIDQAMRMVQAAHAKAAELGIAVSAAVVDEGGRLIALGKMDKARPMSVDIATHKAYTAASFQMPTNELAGMASQSWFQSLLISSQGRIMASGGGLPILNGVQVVGAIGVSGASEDHEYLCAQAGAAAYE